MLDSLQSSLLGKGITAATLTSAIERALQGAADQVKTNFSQELRNSLAGTSSSAASTATQQAAATSTAGYQSTVNLYKATQTTAEATTADAKLSRLEKDFSTYFDITSTGQKTQIAGGTVTRNEDGSATWSANGKSYTFTRSTPLSEVAANTGLGAQWATDYGVTFDSTSTNTTQSVTAPFDSLESFTAWENGLGSNFAEDYEVPDYIHAMGLMTHGGEGDLTKRYLFFKNNPEYALDYERVRSGQLSQFPTDGSTLVKTDLSTLPSDVATFYRANPDQLLAAEAFNFDPTLNKMVMDGTVQVPTNTNTAEWLASHKWTSSGVVASDNRTAYANADYIGLSGSGGGSYKLAKYDMSSGKIVDFDGTLYDGVTGQAQGKASASTVAALYGSSTTA